MLPVTDRVVLPYTRRLVCCLLVCVFYFFCLSLYGQQQMQAATVQACPIVTIGHATFVIYDSNLRPRGFISFRLRNSNDESLYDLTEDVDASKHGLQSIDIDLRRWATGVYVFCKCFQIRSGHHEDCSSKLTIAQ